MLSRVNFKSKLPKKLQKYASFGVIPKLFLAPFAILILLGFLLAKPFFQFRLYRMVDSRIGHLATNTEMVRLGTILRNQTNKKREIIVYCSESWNCANNALRKLFFRDSLHIRGHLAWLTLRLSSKLIPFRSFKTVPNRNLIIDRAGLLSFNTPLLEFANKDLIIGQKFLDEAQIINSKFVCLHIRDSEYLTNQMGYQVHKHDYRDSDIKTYVAAAEALAEMGYTVFRMGAIVKEPLISKHPRVIDYATNGMRTEFLDIFLGAHCAFAVSTGSGWDEVPQIFRRPVSYFNLLPLVSHSFLSRSITFFPKILLDCDSSEVLTLQQLVDRGAATPCNTQAYKDAGVVIRDLSSEELVDAVTEMAQRVEGTFVETPEQKEMQAKAKHILSTHPKLQPSPNYYPIRAQFASCFLSRYPNFLDGLD